MTRLALTVQADVDMLQFHAVDDEADGDQHRRGPADGGDPAAGHGAGRPATAARQKPDDKLDLLIYDPMPGGSGLLEQMLARWQELVATAKELLAGCVQGCDTACYACLKTFRNQFHHDRLDRHEALELMEELDHDAARRTGTSSPVFEEEQAGERARRRTSPRPGSQRLLHDHHFPAGECRQADRHEPRRAVHRAGLAARAERRWPSTSTA